MRALKIAGSAVAAFIVIVGLLLVIGIPSGFLTSVIQERVERDTGYRLTIAGSTRIGLWPSFNVTLNDVTLEGTQKAGDRDTGNHLTVGSIQADMTLASLWSGHPEITDLVITRPVLNVPLRRERGAAPAASSGKASASPREDGSNTPTIERLKVTDATIVFSNARDRVENRIEGINADATVSADRKIRITGSARAGEHPIKFNIKATAPTPPLERQTVPVDLTLDVPDVLQAPLTGKAEVRFNGSVVMINGLTGTLGDGAFNGWASVDLASKPLVKLDLDFQRLDIAAARGPSATQDAPSSPTWSNAPLDVTGLNYVDAQIRVSAAELNIGEGHFAPVAIDATLASGVLKCGITNLGAYGGQASGEIDIDAGGATPAYTMRADLTGVRALPLLRSAAGFDKLDGKMQAKISVRSSGQSQRAIMSGLNGTAFATFQDGAIRGLNVAQMIRSLTASTLSGWQENREQTTDLSQLSASFRIEQGQATTSDLNLVGPLVKMTGTGTVDLGRKSLAFRVEPKLVMTTQGQGRATDPVGFGIPVVIDGPWAQPRIYPDMAGMLDNPDAAYAKLKEMGQGLFGPGGGLGGGSGLGGLLGGNSDGSGGGNPSDPLGGKLGETLGNLLQQGLSQGRNPRRGMPDSQAPAAPAQNDPPPQQQQPDSQPMNDVLKQLFNR
ncbi:AsmA family protein [Bradyrhizobium sp. dw_411]|uniref:AsmA family protein n=1 Tax=Bradyrhizobium sp. dw_411 TaxID=2720082 RepID=UPI001BCBD85B|nr:AsmA family protein [Bradyrhizobium sp. dw_411]